jgi:mono/diheme cytochrome c family protein
MSWRATRGAAILFLLSAGLFCGAGARAQSAGTKGNARASAQQNLLDEGEAKFHANCGRCHQSPHHLAPRVVMTVERHMRVRATLTDEDVRAIVAYLTQ